MMKLMKMFGIRKCGDCGGYYMDWINHAFGKRHMKFIRKKIGEDKYTEMLIDFANRGIRLG